MTYCHSNYLFRRRYIFCYEHQIYFKKGENCPKCEKEGNKQMRLYKIDKKGKK